jgi:hypothetical protein
MRVLPSVVVVLSVFAGLSQQVLADQRSTPKEVSIVVVPSKADMLSHAIAEGRSDSGGKIGNVKVTFTDGHSEVLTHTGDCDETKVSPKGNVGWVRRTKWEDASFGGRVQPGPVGKDSLVVRLVDGTTKKFPAFGDNYGLVNWKFADDDKAVIVQWRQYRSFREYVQYDLRVAK